MSNKKVVFSILAFAIVAALLTMGRSPQFKMMNGEYVGKSSPGMGGSDAMTTAPMPGKNAMYGRGVVAEQGPTEPSIAPGVAQDSFMMEKSGAYTSPIIGGGYGYGMALDEVNRSLDKNSYHGVVVGNVSEYMQDLKSYLQSVGGKIVSSSQNTFDDMTYASLTVKVPADKFDEVTANVTSKAKEVMNESINVTDVTGQRVNMEDRRQEIQDQLVKKQAELVTAKTDAEKKSIQNEVDRLNQQMKDFVRSQETFAENINFATVSVTAADSEKFFDPESRMDWDDELERAFKSLGKTGGVLVYFLIWVVVYAVIWLPLVLLGRWMWNKMRPGKTGR